MEKPTPKETPKTAPEARRGRQAAGRKPEDARRSRPSNPRRRNPKSGEESGASAGLRPDPRNLASLLSHEAPQRGLDRPRTQPDRLARRADGSAARMSPSMSGATRLPDAVNNTGNAGVVAVDRTRTRYVPRVEFTLPDRADGALARRSRALLNPPSDPSSRARWPTARCARCGAATRCRSRRASSLITTSGRWVIGIRPRQTCEEWRRHRCSPRTSENAQRNASHDAHHRPLRRRPAWRPRAQPVHRRAALRASACSNPRAGGDFKPVNVAVTPFRRRRRTGAHVTSIIINNFKRSVFLQPVDAGSFAERARSIPMSRRTWTPSARSTRNTSSPAARSAARTGG